MPIVHAFIIAGGKGTRSKNPDLPKILQDVGNRTLLEHQLESLDLNKVRKATFLLGFGSEKVEKEIRRLDKKFPGIQIKTRIDGKDDNQVTALQKALSENLDPNEIALIVLGDILWRDAIEEDLKDLVTSDFLAIILVHPNLHPSESDVFTLGTGNLYDNLVGKKESRIDIKSPSRALTGVFYLKRESLRYFSNRKEDLLEALIRPLFLGKKLLIRNTSGYYQDTGTATRLLKAERDLKSGNLLRRGSRGRAAVFLDRDGTLVFNQGSPRKDILRSEILEPVARAIGRANSIGIPIFVVTNQPGIAKGKISRADFLYTQAKLENLLADFGAVIDDFDYCPHYPHGGFPDEISELKVVCSCRKPASDMILGLAKKHKVDLSSSILLGDSLADQRVAGVLSMNFAKCSYAEKSSSNTADKLNVFLDGISS